MATREPALSPALSPALGETAWAAVAERLSGRPFLRSEGLAAAVAMPMIVAPWLVEQARELVTRFDRFFRAVVNATGPLADEPARKIGKPGEPYERIAELESTRSPLVLARFDCVLDETDTLRVIELNPIGVATLHLRALAYTARELERMDASYHPLAHALDAFSVDKMASIRRFIDETLASRVEHPVVAILLLPGMHRGSKLQWAHELGRAGMDVVFGTPADVRVDAGSLYIGTRRCDALWADWFLYLGYQQQRYEQTRFASKVGDYSGGARAAEAVLTLPGFADALLARAFTIVSPLRAYRALSKALLAWPSSDALWAKLALPDDDRAYLLAHLAETHDHHARDGAFSLDEAERRRSELVLKPCRFGGSHGVLIGRDTGPDAWAKKLKETWSDPEWVLQAFVAPSVADISGPGAQLSYGVYDYAGTLGGILVRAAHETIVSARTSHIVAAVNNF